MKVPYFIPAIGPAEKQAVLDVLESGWLTTGTRCKEFETRFAEAVHAPYALALNSCTAGLHLALEAIGVTTDDRVLVPSLTFAATAEVVRYLNALPVFVDSDPSDCNISLPALRSSCERLRNGGHAAKAVIVVHYGGKMVDMLGVREIADEFGLRVIEDAAHAFPSWIQLSDDDRLYPGAMSDAAAFSFYANKTITTGEGGMVVTRDPELAKRMRIMSLHGIDRDPYNRYANAGSWYYEIIAPGYKYNLTDIAAALGCAQLARAESLRAARATIAEYYTRRLQEVPAIKCLQQESRFINSWHLYAVRVDRNRCRNSRNEIIDFLKARGITTSVHWTALHLMPYYKGLGVTPDGLANATALSEELISLPIYSSMNLEQVDYVVDTLTAAAVA
jgi:dTDP-4-amino-4,6-dideoxygalactose transaminase